MLSKLKSVDYNWLLVGKGSPTHEPRFCDSEFVEGEAEILYNPKTPEPLDDRGHIRLVSYNQHHEPMDVPLTAINAMAIVKFSIRKNRML